VQGVYPGAGDGKDKRTGDRRDEKELDSLVGGAEDRSSTGRGSNQPQVRRSALKNRENAQGAGRGSIDVEDRPWMKRVDGDRMWKETYEDQEEDGSDAEPKRRWEKSGMAWMKRNDQRLWADDGRLDDEEGETNKRRWEKFITHEQNMATVELITWNMLLKYGKIRGWKKKHLLMNRIWSEWN